MGGCCTYQRANPNQIRVLRSGTFVYEVNSIISLVLKSRGTGCKLSPEWKTKATREEVNKKREEFWETRTSGNPQAWEVLRKAVDEQDPQQASTIIHTSGLKFRSGLLMTVIDQQGQLYELPPYILSDPIRVGEPVQPTKKADIGPEKKLNVKLRCATYDDFNTDVSNHALVDTLKQAYADNFSLSANKFRLFFNGKELKKDVQIGNYKIGDNTVIQVFLQG